MASLRTDIAVREAQSIIKVIHLAAAVTGDTITWKLPMKSFVVQNQTTTDVVGAIYSSTTQLFTLTVANTPDVDIWILQ